MSSDNSSLPPDDVPPNSDNGGGIAPGSSDGDDSNRDFGKPPAANQSSQALRARVPDHVADGCFSTGAIVMTGPSEFIVDFLQTIGRPHKIAKRVVIPHPVMPQFVDALRTNLDLYQKRFGAPPTPPPAQQTPQANRPTPQEIYDDLKLPDQELSGVYANGVMIGHGASEFGMDFLTSFFPQSAVSARVFVAAGQIPRLIESLKGAMNQLEQRRRQANPGPASLGQASSPNQSGDNTSGGDRPPHSDQDNGSGSGSADSGPSGSDPDSGSSPESGPTV